MYGTGQPGTCTARSGIGGVFCVVSSDLSDQIIRIRDGEEGWKGGGGFFMEKIF